ncbi:hypothetical protein ACFL1X_03590 [Candidatus Hydrogenedentota bacterium]
MKKSPGGAYGGARQPRDVGGSAPIAFGAYGGSKQASGVTVPLKNVSELPKGKYKLPKLTQGEQVYAMLAFADKERLLLLDRAKKSDAFFTRMHFDANGNGDLTDDAPLTGSITNQTKTMRKAEFSKIKLNHDPGAANVPNDFNVQVSFTSKRKSPGPMNPEAIKLVLNDIEPSAVKNAKSVAMSRSAGPSVGPTKKSGGHNMMMPMAKR